MKVLDYFSPAEDLSYLLTRGTKLKLCRRLHCELNNACWLPVSFRVFCVCFVVLSSAARTLAPRDHPSV